MQRKHVVEMRFYLHHGVKMDSVSSSASSKSDTTITRPIGIINCLVVAGIVLTPATTRVIKPFPGVTVGLKHKQTKKVSSTAKQKLLL